MCAVFRKVAIVGVIGFTLISMSASSASAQALKQLILYWSPQRVDNFVTLLHRVEKMLLELVTAVLELKRVFLARKRKELSPLISITVKEEGTILLLGHGKEQQVLKLLDIVLSGQRDTFSPPSKRVQFHSPFIGVIKEKITLPLQLKKVFKTRGAGYAFIRIEGYAYPSNRCS